MMATKNIDPWREMGFLTQELIPHILWELAGNKWLRSIKQIKN